jgi:hypothetical protein
MRITTIITDIVQIINRSHSDLQNLTADDHTHYLLVDGSRALTGDLNLGGYNIKSTNSLLKFDTEFEARNAADTDYIPISAKSFRVHASVYFATSGASIYGYASAVADNKFIVNAGGAWKTIVRMRGATLAEDGRFEILAGAITGDLRDGNASPGTSGQVLTSQGAGVAPVWGIPPKLEYVEINPQVYVTAYVSADTWFDWDISTYVPANARAVEVAMYPGDVSYPKLGLRADGSTINRTLNFGNRSFTMHTSLPATRIIEVFAQAYSSNNAYALVGYWK